MIRQLLSFIALSGAFFVACNPAKEEVDLLLQAKKIYTVDSAFSTADAMAVHQGKVVETGTYEDLKERYQAKETVDASDQYLYPGFIDAHCHFYRYGLGLQNADLVGTSSMLEVLDKLREQRKAYPNAPWLLGRGWDQNDWEDKRFPTKLALDTLFPNVPVMLTRIDGHAVLVNSRALEIAGITADTKVEGGRIDLESNEPNGILVDNAIDLVSKHIPEPDRATSVLALQKAQENCFAVGLTTVDDAGLDRATIELIDSLQQADALHMRMYAMVNPTEANRNWIFANGPIKTDKLHVKSFKVYADGALGSRGASLLAPYHDAPEQTGFLLQPAPYFKELAAELADKGFQMNTHCIGDSANRVVLQAYADVLPEDNDLRWRIEHAQVVTPTDLTYFANYSIIPSVQPTHATSDMYWADERLGDERVKTAYAYQDLLEASGVLALGSDFPIESINPILGFYAAVARQDMEQYPEGGFQPENALSREDALRGMTIWAAYSNFEEDEKGSLEAGKLADFVLLDTDLLEASYQDLAQATVNATYIGGKKVFQKTGSLSAN